MQRCSFLHQNPDLSLLLKVLLGNKGLDVGALSRLLISYVILMQFLLTFLEVVMQINNQKGTWIQSAKKNASNLFF